MQLGLEKPLKSELLLRNKCESEIQNYVCSRAVTNSDTTAGCLHPDYIIMLFDWFLCTHAFSITLHTTPYLYPLTHIPISFFPSFFPNFRGICLILLVHLFTFHCSHSWLLPYHLCVSFYFSISSSTCKHFNLIRFRRHVGLWKF